MMHGQTKIKFSNFGLGWNGDCNGFVEQLREIERVRE